MRFAFAEPRGHGKTTRWAIGYPIYALAELGYRFIVLIGPTATAAQDSLRAIEAEIEANPMLQEDYPHLRPKKSRSGQFVKWTDTDQIYASGQRVAGRGIFSSFRGFNERGSRPDLIIVDDVERDDAVMTAAGRNKLEKRFRRVVMGLQGAAGMVLFVVGNLIHPDGLLAKLTGPDYFKSFTKSIVAAIISDVTKEIAYPELWTYEALDFIRREDMGRAAFEIEYQNNPILASGDYFSREKCYYFNPDKITPATWKRIAAVDPAIGETVNHCYTSIVAGLVAPSGNMYVVDWVTDRMNPDRMADELLRLHERWNFTRIGFETNAAQKLFLDVFRLKGLRLPFVGVSSSKPKSTADRKGRIDLLVIPVGNGKIRFDETWALRENYRVGMEQLFAYMGPDSRDFIDGPDALAACWAIARKMGPRRRRRKHRPDPKAKHKSFLLE